MISKKRAISRKEKNNKSFLSKLYDIINDITYKDIISWNIEGNGIIIKNTIKLCELVLPKFYNHRNYSSFVRQLNLYGFHKSKGMLKEGEGFEHEIFNKNNSKEQIILISLQNKQKRLLYDSLKYNDQENTNNNNDILYLNNENLLLRLLSEKIENNSRDIKELKNEMIALQKINKNLKDKIQMFHNNFKGHNIFLNKFLKFLDRNQKSNNIKKMHKSKNIKEFFQKYLYHLKIYSPYINARNYNNNNYEITKKESEEKDTFNNFNIKDILNANIENIPEESSFFEISPKIGRDDLDLNLNNSNSLSSCLYLNKDAK